MEAAKHPKLNQWFATAISGNDILSSALYVSGIAIIYAGMFAPLVLLFIGVVLFFYKSVYTEVVEALPINGGAYNCLLNSTSKTVAAIAGITTVLSYMATAVISGNTAVNYVRTIVSIIPSIPATIVLLLVFALLVIGGIKDSAKVAFGIFALHVLVLIGFVIFGLTHIGVHPGQFLSNLSANRNLIITNGGIAKALFFAFAASLLGVSGFESSANFVEEQDKGVFRKTLRNMLLGVAIFNPLIAISILGAMPYGAVATAKDFTLSAAAHVLGGPILQYIVVIDAFMVLAGAVLTAYVGVGGLMYRMSSDGCLPDFLTTQNSKGSYPKIVIMFFLLCTAVLLLTRGDLLAMAGVYTVAFLSVMTLFALGNFILRQTRTELKRTYNAPALFVLFALLSTAAGVVGNILIDDRNLVNFLIFFVPALLLVLSMVYLDVLLKWLLKVTSPVNMMHQYIQRHFEDLTSGTIVAFVNHVDKLHPLLKYINRNETAWNVILVHCKNHDNKDDWERHNEIKEVLPYLQEAGVYSYLNISMIYHETPFGPKAINEISKKLKVRKNRILIGSIHEFHDFDYADLGGVRIVF